MTAILRRIAVYVFLVTGVVWMVLSAGCGGSGGGADTEPAAEKIKITSLDELPAHAYPLSGTVAELLNDPEAMTALKESYRADIETDLATYQIDDVATLQDKYSALVTVAMLDGRHDDALKQLDEIRALEDKEAARLMNGLVTRSMIVAHEQVGEGATQDQYLVAFERELAGRLFDLPYEVVQDQIKAAKGQAEYLSENLLLGIIESRIEPAVAAQGELSADMAGTVLRVRRTIDQTLVLNPTIAKVYQNYLEANAVEKQDIWTARAVTLESGQGHEPVVVAIWDSGVDYSVFGGQMYVNAGEAFDGADTDGNGFVDDVHGIAFDVVGAQSPDMLHPLGDQEGKLDIINEYMKGFIDITSAVESYEATAVRQTLGTLQPAEVGDFLTTLSFGGLFMHGTHVAGIALEGNPYAQALIARITFDYHPTPMAMNMEICERMAAGYQRTTEYFSEHGVRVANMSWGWTFKEIEASLEANGVGESGEERAKMAREMIDTLSEGLHAAMAATPEILYVTAAGNDDNDVEFDVTIPSSYEMPNLMVIGAVDQAGDPTSFTSGGKNVRIYANGFEVESYVPGGERMKMSGTSMASPNVCNLAAKLFTLQPDLTPEQAADLIEQGADAHPDDPDLLRINPKKTMEALQR